MVLGLALNIEPVRFMLPRRQFFLFDWTDSIFDSFNLSGSLSFWRSIISEFQDKNDYCFPSREIQDDANRRVDDEKICMEGAHAYNPQGWVVIRKLQKATVTKDKVAADIEVEWGWWKLGK
jgi:hypothetical protein